MKSQPARRAFVSAAGAGALLLACGKATPFGGEPASPKGGPPAPKGDLAPHEGEAPEVGATEDLMREHGVIRRVLVIYRLAATRLLGMPTSLPLAALRSAATLMQKFGEDYHERQLEEAHLFPAVRKANSPAAAEVNTLLAQHQRGREITAYILSVTQQPHLLSPSTLAAQLDGFALMYEEHAAREDTIVFPAWKQALTRAQRAEMAELFEDIEHETFGKDGFDDAVKQVLEIERAFGLDPAALTAAPPPKL